MIHTTADGYEIKLDQTVYIRIGNPYPKPGVWRCRKMIVERIKRTGKVVLRPTSGIFNRKRERMPEQIFASRSTAKTGGEAT